VVIPHGPDSASSPRLKARESSEQSGELRGDAFIEATARRMRASGEAPTVESAASALLDQIHDIHQHFEDLDRLIESIDIRHSQFVDSAVRTVELQLSGATTTSGQLHDLLDRTLHGEMARDIEDDEPPNDDVIVLFELELTSAESLAPPARAAFHPGNGGDDDTLGGSDSRIFLHNWRRFTHHVIDVEDSLYLAGHNGSGKSSVLDAIQIVLVADLGRVRFNSSAQERSARNLDSYVRGKIGEGRLLRPGNTVAYVALEFTDTRKDMRTTLGVCIECAEGRTPERTYVILTGTLDPSLFMIDGRERSRRELRQALRARPHAHAFDTIGEYRDEMLNRLGGLNERFFDLFLRALTFQPITNINEFVEQWLLSEAPLDLVTLQRVVERLQDLQRSAVEVEIKVEALQAIDDQQREVCRLHDRHENIRYSPRCCASSRPSNT